MNNEIYIGDGVYLSFDGYQICLRAPRDYEDHLIFLNEDNLMPLIQELERHFKLKINIEKAE